MCISPCLIKLPQFAKVDVTPESHVWATQVCNTEVVPYSKNGTKNSFHGKYCSSNVLHPLFCWLEFFILILFTKIAETSASPPSIIITLYESQIYK